MIDKLSLWWQDIKEFWDYVFWGSYDINSENEEDYCDL